MDASDTAAADRATRSRAISCISSRTQLLVRRTSESSLSYLQLYRPWDGSVGVPDIQSQGDLDIRELSFAKIKGQRMSLSSFHNGVKTEGNAWRHDE